MAQFFLNLIKMITEPSVELASEADRLRARLLSGMVLPYTLIQCLALIISFLIPNSPVDIRIQQNLAIIIIFYALSYILSRTRWYEIAGIIFTSTLVYGVFEAVLAEHRQDRMVGIICFLSIGVLISCIVMSMRYTIFLVAFVSAGFFYVYKSKPEFEGAVIFFMWLFFIMVTTLGFISTFLLRRAEELVNKQQSKLIISQRMAALGEVAGGVAHEVNNPLAIISTYTQVLERQIDREALDLEHLKKTISSINLATERIKKIVENLIRFSRPDLSESLQNVPLEQIIQSTLDLCYESIQNKKINLVVIYNDPELIVTARPTEISQALLHLVNNAIDEVVNLPEPKIWIIGSRVRSATKISVLDNGKGVALNLKDKIFQPFYTSKFADKHTGLGLNVAHGIASSHGGSLVLETDKHGRTKFSLEI